MIRSNAMRAPAGSALVVGALLMTITAGVNAQSGEPRTAIEAGNKQFSAAFAKGDAAAIANLYTVTAEANPPNGDVVRGRAAIEKMWKSVIDSGIAQALLTTRDVESAGDLAYESGAYELKTKDGKTADRGKYVVVWKRGSGRWLLHRDIWNTSIPPK